jgi:hypothetical protein
LAHAREVVKLPLLHRLFNPPVRHPPKAGININIVQSHDAESISGENGDSRWFVSKHYEALLCHD